MKKILSILFVFFCLYGYGQIQIGVGFQVNSISPIDNRMIFSDTIARNDLNVAYRYEGLKCYVVEDKRNYQLVGGIYNSNWVSDVANGFTSASISLSGSTVKEVGTNSVVSMTATITQNDETTLTSGRIDQLSPVPTTIKSWGEGGTSQDVSVTFYPIQNIPDSLTKTFSAYELVGNNGNPTTISSNTVTLSSVYPYLYGMSDNDLTSGGSAFYTAMSKNVQHYASSTKATYNSSSLKYAYFACPSSYAPISVIKDHNDLDWTNSFTLYDSVNVSSAGLLSNWNNVLYNIYRSNNTFTTIGDWVFTFGQDSANCQQICPDGGGQVVTTSNIDTISCWNGPYYITSNNNTIIYSNGNCVQDTVYIPSASANKSLLLSIKKKSVCDKLTILCVDPTDMMQSAYSNNTSSSFIFNTNETGILQVQSSGEYWEIINENKYLQL